MSYFENFGGKHSPVNIHNEIQMAALVCASKGSHFGEIWLVLLQKLLQYWNVSTSMDLRDATTIMLHSAGYLFEEDWHDTHPSNSYTFWYKYEDRPNFLTVRTWRQYNAFRMTIAVFETINYWFWYDHNISIVFNKETLSHALECGKIYIDWDSYVYDQKLNKH